jgi:hypothetical protein
MGEMENIYNILVRKREGKRPLEDLGADGNIRMDLREIGWKGVDWMQLAQDKVQWQAFEFHKRCGHFPALLSDYWPLKTDSAPWNELVMVKWPVQDVSLV